MEALKPEVVSWSLASDQKLLEALQSLSTQFLDRSQACISKVNELSSEVATSEVSLRNTFNEFLMLGNTQFIENRVYDDDGEDDDEKAESKIEDFDPMVLMREAFQSGFGALSQFHSEQYVAHQFENIYDRPIPFVIGTDCYNNSQSCGLGEEDFAEEEEHLPVTSNITEETEEFDSQEEDRYSQEDFDLAGRTSSEIRVQQQISSSAAVEETTSVPRSTGNALKDMLNAQIRAKNSYAEADVISVNRESGTEKPAESLPLEEDDEEGGDMFATQDDPYSLFGSSRAIGAKFNPKTERDSLANLFGTVDDEIRNRSGSVDSLFGVSDGSRAPSKDVSPLGGPIKRGSVFGTDDDKLFDEVHSTVTGQSSSLSAANQDATGTSGKAIPIILPRPSITEANRRLSSIENSTADDDIFSADVAKVKSNISSANLGIKDAKDLFGAGLFGGNALDDNYDGDLFSQARVKEVAKSHSSAVSTKFSSLFGEDDDDDSTSLFAKKPAANLSAPKPAAVETNPQTRIPLLDDVHGGPLGSSSTSVTSDKSSARVSAALGKSKSIFDDDDDDEGSLLFSKPNVSVALKPADVATTSASTFVKRASVFDDDEDNDDLFGAKVSTVAPKNLSASVVFSEQTSSIPAASKQTAINPTTLPSSNSVQLPIPKKSSVFDDDSDDIKEDDFLSRKPAAISKIAAPIIVALPTEVASKQTTINPTTLPSSNPVPSIPKRSSMFDDDSDDNKEDDFLSRKPAAISKIAAPIIVALPTEVASPLDDVVEKNAGYRSSTIGNSSDVASHTASVTRLPGAVALPIPLPPRILATHVSDSEEDEEKEPVRSIAVNSNINSAVSAAPLKRDAVVDDATITAPPPSATTAFNATATIAAAAVVTSTIASAPSNVDSNTCGGSNTGSSASETNGKVIGGIMSRISGLDPSKIVLPGQSVPAKARPAVPTSSLFGDDHDDNPLGSVSGSSASNGSLFNANMNRATVAKNSRKAPTKKKSLFDDDDDDDNSGLFASAVKAATAKSSSRSIDRNLFDDDDDAFLQSSVKPAAVPISAASITPATNSKLNISSPNKSIFAEDSGQLSISSIVAPTVVSTVNSSTSATNPISPVSEKFTVLSSAITSAAAVQAQVVGIAPKGSVFGDDDDNEGDSLFGGFTTSTFSAPVTKPTITPSAVGTTKFAAPDPLAIAGTAPKKSVFEESEPSDDLFASRQRSSMKIAPAVVPANIPDTSDIPVLSNDTKRSGNTSLFGDDEDDDLLLTKKPIAVGSSSVRSTIAPTKTISAKALSFVDDDNDDPLFGGSGARLKPAGAVSPTPVAARTSPVPLTSLKKQRSLFGDDDDDPLAALGGGNSSSSTKKSLFDDD